jgi:tripartite-type tricarboxylate transporter receptor subunit TctC
MITRRRCLELSAVWSAAFSLPAFGADYPGKPVRIVVPYGAGNSADVGARLVGEALTTRLGTPFIVENKPGANGVIGISQVVKSPPDGYTLLATSLGPIVINPTAFKSLPYDPLKDLVPVAGLMSNVMVLVASEHFQAQNLKGAVDLVKATPGKFAYGTYGPGSFNQLLTSAMTHAAGMDMIEVAYKSGSEVHMEVLSGRISLLFDVFSNVSGQIKAGKMRPLAVSAPQRSPLLPDVPTLQESGISGLSGLNAQAWTALFAPAGTPREVVDFLSHQVNDLFKDPQFSARFSGLGADLFPPQSPEEFASFVRDEYRKWARTVTDAGFRHTL